MAFFEGIDETGNRFGYWNPDENFSVTPPVRFPIFSCRIKAARKAKKLSISDMAEKIGVDFVQYSKYDNGRELPDDDTLRKINRILFTKLED